MSSQREKAERFLALHHGATPLLLPNAWDAGTAVLFASLGFEAVATTSSGHAATLGRLDGSVTRDEALEHATALAGAVDIPVSGDYENGFAHEPAAVAANITLAMATGLAGGSVEDFARGDAEPIYEIGRATERVAAASEAAHRGDVHFVITARAENYLHGNPDLAATITRLQRYQEAGADVLYAPGITSADDIRTLVGAVDRPINILALPGVPPVAELAELGVGRVSVGGTFTAVAMSAVVAAATELRDAGTYGFIAAAGTGRKATRAAFYD